MNQTYESVVWSIVDYLDQAEELIKNLSDENKLLHKRLQMIELVLTRLVSKEPIR